MCKHYRYTPNAETIVAIEETEAMIRGKIPALRFDSAEEMFRYLEM
ncbi:MAG: hypothetical protein MdMp014T_1053 [Treponematales bacterium]